MRTNLSDNIRFLKQGLLLVFVIICFSGCSNREILDDSQNSIFNIPYSIKSSMSLVIRRDYIANLYGKPDIVRKQKDYSYEIRSLSDGSKFFVFYDSTNIVIDSWRLTELLERSEFEKIITGESTFNDVKKIDPYFQIFEYSQNKDAAISEHRLKDSGLITVEYKKINNVWVVDSVKHEQQDPSGFVSKLLPEDKALILK